MDTCQALTDCDTQMTGQDLTRIEIRLFLRADSKI